MSENQNTQGPDAPPRENEIADYYEGVKQLEMQGYETGIKKARNALFVTAALVLVGELIATSSAGVGFPPLLIAVIAGEVGIFIGLALWTKTKPYTAIITGLILFILMWIASVMLTEAEIYHGILVKGIIIYFLASALGPAKAWEQAKKS